MRAYNFAVSGPEFTNFLSPNVEYIVVDHLPFQFSISPSVPEIFAIKFWSCPKSRLILDVFALSAQILGEFVPQKSNPDCHACLAHVTCKNFMRLLALAKVIGVRTLNFGSIVEFII